MFPTQRKTSIILPIPKVIQPAYPADFRPISITPVLSRLLERLIVHTFIYPTFITPPMAHQLSDQYAFRQTGSTTDALIALHQKTTIYLTVEAYVALFSLDFTKAFDTVLRSQLARKLSLLDIPDAIYNFIICFPRGPITRDALCRTCRVLVSVHHPSTWWFQTYKCTPPAPGQLNR